MKLLSEREMYGYELTQTVARRSGGVVEVPEGSLYPTMYKLGEKGYVTDERRQVGKRQVRVYYSLTEKGKEQLDLMLQEYYTFLDGMERVFTPPEEAVSEQDTGKKETPEADEPKRESL